MSPHEWEEQAVINCDHASLSKNVQVLVFSVIKYFCTFLFWRFTQLQKFQHCHSLIHGTNAQPMSLTFHVVPLLVSYFKQPCSND